MLFTDCGSTTGGATGSSGQGGAAANQVAVPAGSAQATTTEKVAGKKILVAYFSRTGDNYAVGNIAKGNTHIVADMIAAATGADLFEIKTVKAYPDNYRECTGN